MSRMFIHDVIVERRAFDDSEDVRDAYGQPVETVVTTAARGLVQPRSSREMDDSRSAGTELSDYVVFLPMETVLDGAAAILWNDLRYEVLGLRPFEFGRLRHYEVDTRLIRTPPVTFAEAGS